MKKKVLFGITSLELGGAERVLVDISNKLCEKYDISIFSIYDNGALKSELNKNIRFISLYNCKYDELTKVQRMWSPIRILLFSKIIYNKKIKKDYDIEISFLEGPITRLFSNKNNRTRKIAWIHNDIKKVFGSSLKAKIKYFIDKITYKKYDNLVFVSKDNMKQFKEVYSDINPNKMQVIYNYINSDLVLEKAEQSITELGNYEGKNLVTVCRLVEQKAIDRLIKVHSRLIREGYKHNIFVIGDGPERAHLQDLINVESVNNSFFLLGKKNNPYPYIKGADYFCLLSYFEGYGMVLEEAKILNKNIIITDTAARESVTDYKKCIILENSEDGIYNGMKKILNSKDEKKSSFHKYDNEKSIQDIIDLIENKRLE